MELTKQTGQILFDCEECLLNLATLHGFIIILATLKDY